MRLVLCVAIAAVTTLATSQGKGLPLPVLGARIMAVGDSITEGEGAPGGFRAPLHRILSYYGVFAKFVGPNIDRSSNGQASGHAGFGGWSTRDVTYGRNGRGRLSDWLRAYQPSTLLVMTGTNDRHDEDQSQRETRYDKLLGVAFRVRPNLKVVLSAIPRSRLRTGRLAFERRTYLAVRNTAARWRAKGYAVQFSDPYTNFDPNLDLADDYHPNARGYAKIASAYLRALRRMRS